jgi:hypothetical protein
VNKSGCWQEGIKAANLRLGSFVEVYLGRLGFGEDSLVSLQAYGVRVIIVWVHDWRPYALTRSRRREQLRPISMIQILTTTVESFQGVGQGGQSRVGLNLKAPKRPYAVSWRLLLN